VALPPSASPWHGGVRELGLRALIGTLAYRGWGGQGSSVVEARLERVQGNAQHGRPQQRLHMRQNHHIHGV
jgi:hypothetical protein